MPVCSFLITIDVEDWFQVENLRAWNPIGSWDSRELRVERNVHRLLDVFDEVRGTLPSNSLRATFFVLGWIAERLPGLVREIAARGHEVASHGQSHRMCRPLPDAELREELGKSKHLLEDIVGQEVIGFRAPNFSVDDRVLGLIAESGYRYDSSYNNFSLHARYGKITLKGHAQSGIAAEIEDGFYELPISNLPLSSIPACSILSNRFRSNVLPWGGGAYFRLLPFSLFAWGVRSILDSKKAYIFYLHPWEIDPEQPRVREASFGSLFKHYTNLAKTEDNIGNLIRSFSSCRFASCRDYLKL